jgi:hypothetical protein
LALAAVAIWYVTWRAAPVAVVVVVVVVVEAVAVVF